jgi:hypothetical protein
MDPYNPYILYDILQYVQLYGFGTKSRQFWARFWRWISNFCSLFLGFMEESIQLIVGMENEIRRRPYNNMYLALFLRQNFWDCFGVVRYFPWLEM